MKVKEHFFGGYMEREREQQELEEHLYFMTQKALKHAAQYLPQEEMDVLMFHCGFTDNDLFPINEGAMQ